MDRRDRLRMSYTAMLLRSYSRKMQDGSGVIDRFQDLLRKGEEVQRATLARILERNADTCYGRRFDFGDIDDYDSYRRQVPIVSYDDLRPYVERMLEGEKDVLIAGAPSYFSTTSGSTAEPKFIPGTQANITAGCDALLARNAILRRDHPQAFEGQPLYIVGSAAEGKTKAGVTYGAMTGFSYHSGQIGFSKPPFPYGVFTLSDYAARYRTILRLALAAEDLSAIFVYNPSTLRLLFELAASDWDELLDEMATGGLSPSVEAPESIAEELAAALPPAPERAARLRELRDAGPRAWWPKLSVLVCWKGGSLGFYLDDLRRWIGDLPVRDLGILASEAVMTIPVDDDTAGGVLLPESCFFEFVPMAGEDRDPRGCWQLEVGDSYRILLTTYGGLYRYDLADVVRVERFEGQMPVLSFLHRAGRVHSFTGEKLTEQHVTEAVSIAVASTGMRLAGFTAVPVWEHTPFYELQVELASEVSRSQRRRFVTTVEEALCRVNVEYASKRHSGRLGAAALALVPAGSFLRLRRERSREDAQYKEAHLMTGAQTGTGFEILERVS